MVQPSDGDSPAALDQRLVRALEHPVRVGFLRLLAERGGLSPVQALPLLDGKELSLSNVNYHVRVLNLVGLVEPAGDPEPGRGLIFRTTPSGEAAAAALGLFHKKQDDEPGS